MRPVSRLRRPHVALLAVVAVLGLGFTVVLHAQMSAAPWLAPPHAAWAETAALLDRPVAAVGSAVRGQPLFALGVPLANMLVLVLAITVATEQRVARLVLCAVAWSGAVYAAYGIASLILDPGMILWREKTFYVGNLTGTFVNRNTAATHLGACTVIWVLLLLDALRRRTDGIRRRGPAENPPWPAPLAMLSAGGGDATRRIVVPAAMATLCLVATFLTASRAGAILTLAVLGLAILIVLRRSLAGVRCGLATVVLIGLAGVVILQTVGSGVAGRIDAHGLSDEGRLSAWRSTLAMIEARPWTGSGLGTFTAVFPTFRSPDILVSGVWNAAHSTPLELAADVGLPLAAAVVLAYGAALVLLARGSLVRRRDRMVPLAGLCVGLLAGLHTAIDFSLQVAGCSIVVFGVMGAGLAQAFRSSATPES